MTKILESSNLSNELLPQFPKQPGVFIPGIQPRNILIVSDDFLPASTGVGSHLQVITQELVRQGHNVVVVTSRRQGQKEIEYWKDIKIYRLFSIRIAGFYQALPGKAKIRRILTENKIDLIHHHYLSFLLKTVFGVGRALNIPQVYTYHMSDQLLSQPLFMRPFRSLIHRLALHQYNAFQRLISPSENIARQLILEGVKTPIDVISNPVALKPVAANIQKTPNEKFQIFYAGRLATEKNIPLLLRAFAQFLVQFPEARLRLAGEGPERTRLEKMCSELNIASSVEFLGQLNHADLAQAYALCDVFVLPSVLEVQAIVVIEAMRFAKPVIVTEAIGCAEELVREGQNGFIVNSQNESQMVEKLTQLASSPELRDSMGEHSLKKSESFDPEKIVQAVRKIYTDVNSVYREKI